MSTGKRISIQYFQQLYDKGISVKEMAEELSTYTGNKITPKDVRDIAEAYNFDLRKKKRVNSTTRAKKVKYTLETVGTEAVEQEEAFHNAPSTVNVENNS